MVHMLAQCLGQMVQVVDRQPPELIGRCCKICLWNTDGWVAAASDTGRLQNHQRLSVLSMARQFGLPRRCKISAERTRCTDGGLRGSGGMMMR